MNLRKIGLVALLVLGMVGGLLAGCHAQGPDTKVKPDTKIVRRINVHSADPALIALMLKGHQVYGLAPEISTVEKTKR